MYQLLDIASGLLYLAFRIASIPGLVVFHLFIGLWIIFKYTGQLERKLYKYLAAHKFNLHWPAKRSLQVLRPKWIRFQ